MMINFSSRKTGAPVEWGKATIPPKMGKSAKSAMTDSFIERIKAYATEDAKRGVYMSKGYLQMEQAQMRKYVSPDRSGPKKQVMSAIQAALKEPHPMLQALERMLDKLSGGCSANLKICSIQQTAEIRAPNGEVIASYNSLGGGWMENQTKEEHRFFDEATSVYLQAFREARSEMRATVQDQDQALQCRSSTVDVQA